MTALPFRLALAVALSIRADRGFQLSYQGEVHAKDEPGAGKSGHRSVSYVGDIKFLINHVISGAFSGGRKTITWRATPLVKDAPAATLRVAPLP